jgi:acyl-coenzyme A thioesterase PaaI-like protein
MDDDAQPQHAEAVAPDDSEPRPLPTHTSDCFGCGTDNSSGLGIQPFRLGDQIFADVVFDERHIGGPGLAHGGAIAAACDELLGFSTWLVGAPAVTRALSVDFLAPVPLHQTHRMTAKVDEERGRAILVSLKGTRGEDVAFTAHGVYVRVGFEHFTPFGEIPTPLDELQEQLNRESRR